MRYFKFLIIIFIFFILISNISFAKEDKDITIFLLDTSNSMQFKNKNNVVRFTNALNTANTILKGYNANDSIGIRTIGHYSIICSSRLYAPVKKNNCSKISSTIDFLQPISDGTAIEFSLRQIIEVDFANYPRHLKKHIIIITDGEETCGGDPCTYIKNIRKTRKDILIDVISVLDSDAYFSLYDCLAKTTGGDVYRYTEDISPIINKAKRFYDKDNDIDDELKPILQPVTPLKNQPPKQTTPKSRFEKGLILKHFLLQF